jgi:hypothetical protein
MPICSVPPSRTSVLAYRPIANSASLTGWRGKRTASAPARQLEHESKKSRGTSARAADVGQAGSTSATSSGRGLPRRAISSSRSKLRSGLQLRLRRAPSAEAATRCTSTSMSRAATGARTCV